MKREVLPGQIYRHFKNNLYQIITVATHTETEEKLVVYQALYGTFKTYARPISMFLSEVDREKYPDVKQKYRFELIELEEKHEEQIKKPVSTPEKKVQVVEVEEPKVADSDNESAVNPDLLRFLDAETYEEKLQIVIDSKKRLDETTLHSMASAMDITLAEGSRDNKIESLVLCLQTLNKYECRRLR